jgi:hypothetical protein
MQPYNMQSIICAPRLATSKQPGLEWDSYPTLGSWRTAHSSAGKVLQLPAVRTRVGWWKRQLFGCYQRCRAANTTVREQARNTPAHIAGPP